MNPIELHERLGIICMLGYVVVHKACITVQTDDAVY
jgi:hypothetical protein